MTLVPFASKSDTGRVAELGRFGGLPESVRQARRMAADVMADWGFTASPATVGDLLLAVHELALNAVTQGTEGFGFKLELLDDRVRVEVSDKTLRAVHLGGQR